MSSRTTQLSRNTVGCIVYHLLNNFPIQGMVYEVLLVATSLQFWYHTCLPTASDDRGGNILPHAPKLDAIKITRLRKSYIHPLADAHHIILLYSPFKLRSVCSIFPFKVLKSSWSPPQRPPFLSRGGCLWRFLYK